MFFIPSQNEAPKPKGDSLFRLPLEEEHQREFALDAQMDVQLKHGGTNRPTWQCFVQKPYPFEGIIHIYTYIVSIDIRQKYILNICIINGYYICIIHYPFESFAPNFLNKSYHVPMLPPLPGGLGDEDLWRTGLEGTVRNGRTTTAVGLNIRRMVIPSHTLLCADLF